MSKYNETICYAIKNVRNHLFKFLPLRYSKTNYKLVVRLGLIYTNVEALTTYLNTTQAVSMGRLVASTLQHSRDYLYFNHTLLKCVSYISVKMLSNTIK